MVTIGISKPNLNKKNGIAYKQQCTMKSTYISQELIQSYLRNLGKNKSLIGKCYLNLFNYQTK